MTLSAARPSVGPAAGSSHETALVLGALALLLTGLDVRSTIAFGLVALAAVFVPMERLAMLRHQRSSDAAGKPTWSTSSSTTY